MAVLPCDHRSVYVSIGADMAKLPLGFQKLPYFYQTVPLLYRANSDSYHKVASRSRTPNKSGFASITGDTGSLPSISIRSIAVLIVNARGSSASFTSSHVRGIDTDAPGSGRTLNGATMSWPCRFWR